ncbi:MBL fold metallo-hydrolase [Fodinibius halophilus]|uniref:MBL fold metallo-hydrolase n=1 Tax=Fodinibius halophilus TaxID=1736908 RepID=A0A6M1TGI4_9BACT|nr:MBL fold metallo-hydrolase [Fodinibius halophilus]NGP89212.1 MBL fold metallo-hydrolase [Fodinibius halophilus]
MQKEKVGDVFIYPICIPTPFAVGDVFCYLINDEKNVLVDTGHYAPNSLSVLEEELEKYGVAVRDLDEIWLTHGHPDHYGQAAGLADQSGAVIYGHPKERANFAANNDGELFKAFFDRHRIPSELTTKMIEQLEWLQQYQQPIEPEWITAGDRLSSGSINVDVHLTPGHAPGHLAFVTNGDVIFSGDLLLGHISTNALINFDADSGERNKSLLQYRTSLQWIKKQQGVVLPGHGKKIRDINEVASHHLSEHQKRYQKIQQLLEQQPMSLMELSNTMFPDPIKEGAIFLVLSEVLGYLDWGIEEGTIYLDETTMEYRTVTE